MTWLRVVVWLCVQGPIQTKFGWHLILVTNRQDPSVMANLVDKNGN